MDLRGITNQRCISNSIIKFQLIVTALMSPLKHQQLTCNLIWLFIAAELGVSSVFLQVMSLTSHKQVLPRTTHHLCYLLSHSPCLQRLLYLYILVFITDLSMTHEWVIVLSSISSDLADLIVFTNVDSTVRDSNFSFSFFTHSTLPPQFPTRTLHMIFVCIPLVISQIGLFSCCFSPSSVTETFTFVL